MRRKRGQKARSGFPRSRHPTSVLRIRQPYNRNARLLRRGNIIPLGKRPGIQTFGGHRQRKPHYTNPGQSLLNLWLFCHIAGLHDGPDQLQQEAVVPCGALQPGAHRRFPARRLHPGHAGAMRRIIVRFCGPLPVRCHWAFSLMVTPGTLWRELSVLQCPLTVAAPVPWSGSLLPVSTNRYSERHGYLPYIRVSSNATFIICTSCITALKFCISFSKFRFVKRG